MGVGGNEIVGEVHTGEKPLEVNSAKKLLSCQIQEITRKEAPELKMKKCPRRLENFQ